MITSSNGNIFRVTGHLCGEFLAQRPVTRSFDVFLDLRMNKRLTKLSWGWWFEKLSCPLWRHCNQSNRTINGMKEITLENQLPFVTDVYTGKNDCILLLVTLVVIIVFVILVIMIMFVITTMTLKYIITIQIGIIKAREGNNHGLKTSANAKLGSMKQSIQCELDIAIFVWHLARLFHTALQNSSRSFSNPLQENQRLEYHPVP